MTVNVTIISENARSIDAVNLATSGNTVFTTNQTTSLAYENTVLNLHTTLSHLSFEGVGSGAEVMRGNPVAFFIIILILVIAVIGIKKLKGMYK